MRRINKAGLDLLKSFEGCKLNAYLDVGGIPTIGWGHTGPEVVIGMTMTQSQADGTLEKDLEKYYVLDHYLEEEVNENQYSALVVLAYNIGLRAVRTSTLLKKINNGDDPSKEWLRWNKVNGKEVAGLTRRRKAELELYRAV